MQRFLKILRYASMALAPWLATGVALAAEGAKNTDEKLRGLGLSGEQVGTPGIGRVLVVFLLVVALAFCASWVLRRYGFTFRSGGIAGTTPIRHLARNTLPGGVACHLVETQGRHVLITVSRSGISSLLLGDAPAAAAASPAAPPASPAESAT